MSVSKEWSSCHGFQSPAWRKTENRMRKRSEIRDLKSSRGMAAQSKTVMTMMPLAMCLNKKKGWRTISVTGGSSMSRQPDRHHNPGRLPDQPKL